MALAGCAGAPPGESSPQQQADQPLARFEFAQLHMGGKTRLVVYAPDEATARKGCEAAFARVAELEQIMSDYRPDSELMRLCAAASGDPVKVSEDLFGVLAWSQEVARRSDGAFDVTVGPLVRLWREARKTKQLPAPETLAEAKARTGWRKLQLNNVDRTVRLDVPGMQLDLGGVAKGYAGDWAIRVLREHGINRALFEAGGDIVVSGPPPDAQGWAVTIKAPRGHGTRTLYLIESAISTSGDTEQSVEIDSKRYSHIVDPRTGLGLTNRVQVTVLAPHGITTDGLSTALSVMSREAGQKLLDAVPNAVVIYGTADERR